MRQLGRQLDYIYQLRRFKTTKPGLEVMRKLLDKLGNPQDSFQAIHIAGTNGKGSTAAFLSSILNQTSLRVGLYTSPHLCRFNERVVVNNKAISDVILSKLITRVRRAATNINPTYFEFTTALAFLYFAEQKVDIAVVEVGMGGHLDATNVLRGVLSVITNIGLDHTQWLGQSKKAITRHKAGIIKPGVPLVTAEEDPTIVSCLQEQGQAQQAPVYVVSKAQATRFVQSTLAGQMFTTSGMVNGTFTTRLLGAHQITNAVTALVTIAVWQQIKPKWRRLTTAAIRRGLSLTRWPGRGEIISTKPFILLDGAHNEPGAVALERMLKAYQWPEAGMLLLGVKKGKNPRGLIDKVVPYFKTVLVTQANYCPLSAVKLARLINQPGVKVQVIPDLDQAIRQAKQDLPAGQMLLVTGSLYLVGDVRSRLKDYSS